MIKRWIKVLLCIGLVTPCFFTSVTPVRAASRGILNVEGIDIWGIIQDGYKNYEEWAADNRKAAADFFQTGLDGAYRLVKGILGGNSVYLDTQKKILDHSLKCFAEGNYTSCKYVDDRVKENEADGRYIKGYSGDRNYYTGGNGTIYNAGDTVYNNFVNTTNKTYTYVTNNNEYVTNNYTNMYYDIKNNYYYTTNNNYTYKYQYTYNYTYYTMIDSNGQEASRKYYFELPDGRNSFNMTEEDIKGYVLNYHITNYDTVYDNDRTLALYHFNGDTYDSGINNLPLIWDSGASTDYLTADSNFEGYLYYSPNLQHKFTVNSVSDGDFAVEWRMYLSDYNIDNKPSYTVNGGRWYYLYNFPVVYLNVFCSRTNSFGTFILMERKLSLLLLTILKNMACLCRRILIMIFGRILFLLAKKFLQGLIYIIVRIGILLTILVKQFVTYLKKMWFRWVIGLVIVWKEKRTPFIYI